MDLPLVKVQGILRVVREPVSLQTPAGEDGDSSLEDFIPNANAATPAEVIDDQELSEQTRHALATLTPREEKILRMRFGIGEKSDHTLEEVGRDFEVTRERIRQIEAKALRKLRQSVSAKQVLAQFVEE